MSKALPLMVPRLLPLHLMLRQANAGEAVQLPPSLALSSEKLQDDGVYLAENGYEGYIYFAQRVPTELVRALLGHASLPVLLFAYSCDSYVMQQLLLMISSTAGTLARNQSRDCCRESMTLGFLVLQTGIDVSVLLA